MDFQAAYLKIPKQEMEKRVQTARHLLSACTLCPWECKVDRLQGEKGHCCAPAAAVVSSFNAHFGEEPPLVGYNGSGTIFFTHCNLDCVFCQNWEISHHGEGRVAETEDLVGMMLTLQQKGCHNINLVTPTPHIAPIMQSLLQAREQGLTLPLVYNCGGYETMKTLSLLDGIVDIYMPDLKYSDATVAASCSGPPDYPERAQAALLEMQRQVGDLKIDADGIARRGLLVRHLVLPDDLAGTKEVVRFLAKKISPRCAINVMGQYYPAYRAHQHPPLDRRVNNLEVKEGRELAAKAGLRLIR